MIIYLSGPDTYRSYQILSDMKEKFARERDPQGMNLVEIRVGDTDDGAIIEQLHAAPFLAEKRMVILKGLIADGSKELHALLHDHIKEELLPDDIIVIAWDGQVAPRAKASKDLQMLLAGQQYSQVFEIPSGKHLELWLAKEINARGATIDRVALNRLVAEAGQDLWQLSHVIDQLVAYAAGRTITTQDVSEFVTTAIDDNIFALVDAAVEGDSKRALTLIRDQYASGKDAQYVFAMLLRQYRIMLDIADLLERGERPDAKSLGLHPFVLKKTLPLVQRSSFTAIERKYLSLVQIDVQTKTGSGDPELLLDVFVTST